MSRHLFLFLRISKQGKNKCLPPLLPAPIWTSQFLIGEGVAPALLSPSPLLLSPFLPLPVTSGYFICSLQTYTAVKIDIFSIIYCDMNNIYSYLSVDPLKVKGVILTSYTSVTLISTKENQSTYWKRNTKHPFRGKK